MIYEPSVDSFLLGEYVKKFCKDKTVLDMGAGSGFLGLIAKKNGAKLVDCADINPEAVQACKGKGLNAFKSDLFSNVTRKYDLIIFNPPYLPADRREDKESAVITTGGKKGSEVLERFLKTCKEHLNHHGKILLVVSNLTGNVEKFFNANGFFYSLLDTKKVFFEELRVYSLEYKK